MDGTLRRTKKYLKYFGQSFCKDKTAQTLMVLIIACIGGILFAWLYLPNIAPPENGEQPSEPAEAAGIASQAFKAVFS